MMPESIIVPNLDPAYDLAVLNAFQQMLLPFEFYMEGALWALFAGMLIWKGHEYLVAPYLK